MATGGVSMPTPMDLDGANDTDTRNQFDKQIAEVQALMEKPLKDGQRGYAVSMSWLKLVFARSTEYTDLADKDSFGKELGPVDNSDLILDIGPQENLKDETGQVFVPMRPDVTLDQDYRIVPAKAWHLIVKWYGKPEGSPIIRYAHETNPEGESVVIYELRPPFVSLFKLANPSLGVTPQTLKEKSKSPPKAIAGRQMSFQKWLKEAKLQTGIPMSTKVRVWKIRDGLPSINASHVNTPSGSRAASPAPPAALLSSTQKSMLVDLNSFLSLDEGNQREVIDIKDQTDNPKYNGKMSLIMAGLVETDTVVLEQQVGSKGEWISEASAATLKKLGIPIEKVKAKNEKETPSARKPDVAPTSGRDSPAVELPKGTKRRPDPKLGRTGLDNLGNTCYQNAATQCLRAVQELSIYFLTNSHKADLNYTNPLGYNGRLASVYASLLQNIYREPKDHFRPSNFRSAVGRFNPIYSTWEQHDSQEFLSFVLDGLSEDLNTIENKPYIEKPDSTAEMVHDRKLLEEFASKHWSIYTARNESPIVDLFSGMYKSTVECPDCSKVSIKFEPYTSLSLPIPHDSHIVYREVTYAPLASPPIKFTVEVSKSDTIPQFRKKVAERMGSDPNKLIGMDVDDDGGVWSFFTNERSTYYDLGLKPADRVIFVELDVAADEDRLLVPIFHRGFGGSSPERPPPSVLSFTKEETHDLAAIYRKILRYVSTLTTRDIFSNAAPQIKAATSSTEDSDTVELTEDDAKSADSRIKTDSVSVQDGTTPGGDSTEDTEPSPANPPHVLAGTIAPHLLELFDVEYIPASYSQDLITGRYREWKKPQKPIISRLKRSPPKTSSASSGDSDDESTGSQPENGGQPAVSSGLVQDKPFIFEREGLILSWNKEAREALFLDPEDGKSTHQNPPYVRDQSLEQSRAARAAKKARGISLDDCLKEFNSEEILSENDAWYCPDCKEFRQAKKKLDIWYAPDILVMHLKRFTSIASSGKGGLRTPTKFDQVIDFPLEDLDISSYISGPKTGKSTKYDLFAIDCHSGTLQFGHYYAYAKNWVTGDWFEFNDSSTSPIRGDIRKRIVTGSNYLLFYRRQSDVPLGGPRFEKAMNIYNGLQEDPEEESENGDRVVGTSSAPSQPILDQPPSWSFSRREDDDDEGSSRRLPGDINGDDDGDLFSDENSNIAIGGGSNSDAGERLEGLTTPGVASDNEAAFEDVPPLLSEGSDDELPVVELKVGDDGKLNDE
ncbi:hypothetical protein N7468_008535 [Penicillium chermesinum]|uniref:ubiquitinyl hydrolase 1 n=1 Tax=Penicillium chermesinum TaxID=63820 RepID=A0A9W9NQF0_9EURO|nr:uncharacterized protein N7468_008535 [Penicillium chermesinum]KAJ5223993.1 hypothetical protein N7468_008535 [Penicillium chermesinum]